MTRDFESTNSIKDAPDRAHQTPVRLPWHKKEFEVGSARARAVPVTVASPEELYEYMYEYIALCDHFAYRLQL